MDYKAIRSFLLFFPSSVCVVLILNYFSNYIYYKHFNIGILNYADLDELLFSQRAFSTGFQFLLIILFSLILLLSKELAAFYFRNLKFKGSKFILYSFLSVPLIWNLFPTFSLTRISLIFSIALTSGFLLFALWISIFHFNPFASQYIRFFLFLSLLVISMCRIQAGVQTQVTVTLSQSVLKKGRPGRSFGAEEERIIPIGNTQNFNLYYSLNKSEGFALPKSLYSSLTTIAKKDEAYLTKN